MKIIAILKVVITGFLLISGINVHAAWRELGSNDVMSVSVDLNTLTRNGDKAQIVSMLDLKKPGTNPSNKQTVNSIIGLSEYDCSNNTYRSIAFKEFSENRGSGQVVSDNKSPSSSFQPIANGSWTAGVLNVACNSAQAQTAAPNNIPNQAAPRQNPPLQSAPQAAPRQPSTQAIQAQNLIDRSNKGAIIGSCYAVSSAAQITALGMANFGASDAYGRNSDIFNSMRERLSLDEIGNFDRAWQGTLAKIGNSNACKECVIAANKCAEMLKR